MCLAFIFYHTLTFIRYIEVFFTFVCVDCVCYNEEFVKLRLVSIHFTVTLAGPRKIVRSVPRTSLYRGSLNRGFTVTYKFGENG